MKTESHSINDVLAKNATSFFIPPFQRAYAWGKQEIERFFCDISRLIDSELDDNERDKLEHFFGTLVIKEEKSGFANKSIVVDGQQRLTTTLLYLTALRDSEFDSEKKDFITNTYLINNSSTFQDKIKLKQVTKDWEAYRALVNGNNKISGVLTSAYELLKNLIENKKKLNEKVKLEHFITAIQRMNVAVIFLDERPYKGEDPQIIFETLNSLGKPLSFSDLIRNYVLLSMESSNQSDIYEKIWHPKIELELQENTSKFFRDYLQLKMSKPLKVVSDNNTKELYQQFKDYVEQSFEHHKDFIEDVVSYVKIYNWILNFKNTEQISKNDMIDGEIKELLRNIFHDIKSEAFKPLVLGLLHYYKKQQIKDEILIKTLKAIRTYLIRRRVMGLTQGENKNIVVLCRNLDNISKSENTIWELLSKLFYGLRLPNDTEIEKELRTINFYEDLKAYSKFILGKIEENNSKVSVDYRDKKITIEHVMPQKLEQNWKFDLGADYERIHKTFLHNIGNLILTEFNSEIGNKSFQEKKNKLNTSSLNFRLSILDKDVWNEEAILSHQSNMIQWFCDTFPLPEELKTNDNWRTNDKENIFFSPKDDDAGEIAEGNKPSELLIFSQKIEVKTWQDVFIEFLKYLQGNKFPDLFEILQNQQDEFFNKNDIFVTWSKLRELVDENFDLTSRYKDLEGKTWDRVKELSDNKLFIHVNISAKTCLDRISVIMDKFFIADNEVKIKLKSKKQR